MEARTYRFRSRYALPQSDPTYAAHFDCPLEIARELGDEERDEEVGRMVRVRTADGWAGDAWLDELEQIV